MPTLYKDYGEYIKHFCSRGGVIEASPSKNIKSSIFAPSLSIIISPVGDIMICGTY